MVSHSRNSALDGLRGLSAILVLSFHYLKRYESLYEHDFTYYQIFDFGFLGAHLFFAISGYVIFWSFEDGRSGASFLKRRFIRLVPTYWLAVLITYTAVNICGLKEFQTSLLEATSNLLLLVDFAGIPYVDDVYWTLAVEVFFYLAMALLVATRQLHNIEKWLLIWVLAGAFLTADTSPVRIPDWVSTVFVFRYAEFFAVGICFRQIVTGRSSALTQALLASCCVAILAAYPSEIVPIICTLLLILYLTVSGRLPFLGWKPFAYLGSISYCLYLTHQNIGFIIINKLYAIGSPGILNITIATVSALLVASCMTQACEKPIRRFLLEKQPRTSQTANH